MIADNCIRLVRDTYYFSLDINGFGFGNYAWKKANIVYQLRRISERSLVLKQMRTKMPAKRKRMLANIEKRVTRSMIPFLSKMICVI